MISGPYFNREGLRANMVLISKTIMFMGDCFNGWFIWWWWSKGPSQAELDAQEKREQRATAKENEEKKKDSIKANWKK